MRRAKSARRVAVPLHCPRRTARGASHLTLVFGIEQSGLPLALFVHGSPWTQGSRGYNPAAQFFTNRGSAVLQHRLPAIECCHAPTSPAAVLTMTLM
jgi:hypothetical protein